MRTLIFIVLIHSLTLACTRVSIENNKMPIGDRRAMLILPGLVSVIKGPKAQRKYFENRGYDVFIPDYLSRKDLDGNYQRLKKFIVKHELDKYKELHVFAYIAGSRSINSWIHERGFGNIKSIVYDRSPLQENAPRIMISKFPIVSRLLFGKMIWDMESHPYEPIENSDSVHIGFLIETKGTKLVYRGQNYFDALIESDWDQKNFGQSYDDFCFIWINHNELYEEFSVIGPQILHFFKNGRFTESALRVRPMRDPFEELKK